MSDITEQELQVKRIEKGYFNIIIHLVLIIIIIMLITYGYLYSNFGSVSKKELQSDYIKKESISFHALNSFEQNQYVSKNKYLTDLKKYKNIKPQIVKEIIYKDNVILSKPRIIEKIITQDKIIEKIVSQDRVINKSKFNVFRCYGMDAQRYRLSPECNKELDKFLQKNTNSQYFEIIAVFNTKDFTNNSALKKETKELRNLLKIGLGKLRVIETMWKMKQLLDDEKKIIVPVSYSVTSPKYRGTIIRAYK